MTTENYTRATPYDNPLVWALTNLVHSYDEETQQVPLLAINEARHFLNLPPIPFRPEPTQEPKG